MYVVLERLMCEKQWSRKYLAQILRVHVNTIDNKLHGKTDWALHEMQKIRACLNVSMPLQELFRWEERSEKDEAE